MSIETKQVKAHRKDKFTKETINGKFVETPTGFAWQETKIIDKWDRTFKAWEKFSEEIVLKNVEDSPLQLKKSIIAHIIFQKEEPNKNVWQGIDTSYWYMKLKYDIRDGDNLYFTQVDGKIFIRDLHFGITSPIALNESNPNYKCTQIGNIKKITAERASEIVKETGTRLIFSRVETDSKGNIVSFGVGV